MQAMGLPDALHRAQRNAHLLGHGAAGPVGGLARRLAAGQRQPTVWRWQKRYGLPLKPGKCGTMTHDYKRHGTTTLFAALNVLDGTIIGRNMQRHRHQEFIRFLNAVDAAVPVGKLVHAIIDNYAPHKHPKVQAWLARHPHWAFHFTPTSASWLNAVETFSPGSPAAVSNAVPFARSPTSRPPSTATLRSTMMIPNPSSGPSPPTPSWPRQPHPCTFRMSQYTSFESPTPHYPAE
jgi:hypothetical protein